MPALPKGTAAEQMFVFCVVVVFVSAVIWVCVKKPIAFVPVLVVTGYLMIVSASENRRLRRVALQRMNDNICTFARSFDCRTIDSWTVRAAYEELQKYFASSGQAFPIRASDRFKEDFGLDGEDIVDLMFAISERSQHDITFLAKELDARQIHTVSDLVTLVSNLPETGKAESV